MWTFLIEKSILFRVVSLGERLFEVATDLPGGAEQAGCDGEGCPHPWRRSRVRPAVLMGSQDQLVVASEHNPATTPAIPML